MLSQPGLYEIASSVSDVVGALPHFVCACPWFRKLRRRRMQLLSGSTVWVTLERDGQTLDHSCNSSCARHLALPTFCHVLVTAFNNKGGRGP